MQHHIYLVPFLPTIIAGVGSVMCPYNLVNDTYTCENNNMLKHKSDFQSPVMSD
jgi:beta-glucosidase